jgi:hypothetical protein
MPVPSTWEGMPLRKGKVNAYTMFDQASTHGLVDPSNPDHCWKYWTDLRTREEYAFDMKVDPNETRSLIGSGPCT